MYQQYFGQAKSAITYLSSDELKELLNDDEKLEERVNDVLKILDQQKQVIIEQNRNFAEENMNKEPELIERKSRISELSEQGKSFCQNIQEQLNELKSKKGDKTPDTMLALLQAAAAECEEKSDGIASKFQETEINIDEYLEKFMLERKLMHSRKLKTEKMLEIMRKQSSNQGQENNRLPYQTPNYPPNFYNSPSYAPYGMPMPGHTFRNY